MINECGLMHSRVLQPDYSTLVSAFAERGLSHHHTLLFPNFSKVRRRGPGDECKLDNKSSQEQVEEYLESYVLPSSYFERVGQTPSIAAANRFSRSYRPSDYQNIPMVLVCGHGSRDSRCGKMGPIVESQFHSSCIDIRMRCNTAMISHIGGHKFAGNVIIYIPPFLAFHGNRLAGMGIWYGRVEPRHVPGIVAETLGAGRIIKELYRGSMKASEDPQLWMQRQKSYQLATKGNHTVRRLVISARHN